MLTASVGPAVGRAYVPRRGMGTVYASPTGGSLMTVILDRGGHRVAIQRSNIHWRKIRRTEGSADMVNLTPKQEMHLRNVRTAAEARRNAKAGAAARAREIVAQEMAEYDKRLDIEVRMAFDAGAPKSQIGDAMGTTNMGTVRDSLNRTDSIAEALRADRPSDDRFAWNAETGVLNVTLSGDDLTAACAAEGWPVEEAMKHGLASAEFTVQSGVLVPASGDFLIEHGRRHPVTVWGLAHEAEIGAWMRGEAKAA
ncbi:hypothetical protein [Agromyces sp. NPDC058104]|uniref:hypothetical protein n=1 Tax=Agromyces sp. NPDC058104 TaxID=3346342 RepID=UPI0036DCCBB5